MEKWSRNQKLKEIIFKLELNNFDLKILLIYKNGAEGSSCNRRQLLTEVCTENERRKQKEKGSEHFYRLVMEQKNERQR
jgi:hypothetical protein